MYPNHNTQQLGPPNDSVASPYAAAHNNGSTSSVVPPRRSDSGPPPRPQFGSPATVHSQTGYPTAGSAYGQQPHGAPQMYGVGAAAPPGQQPQWSQAMMQQYQQQQQPGMYPGQAGTYGGGGSMQPSSTASLFQQQLAQQQAMSASPASQPPPAPVPQTGYPNMAHQQAFAQQQQAYQQQQARASQPPPSGPPSYPQPSTAAPPAQSPQIPNPYTQSARSAGQLSMQELQVTLRGVNLNGMTAERFQQLPPHQQVAVREFLTRTRQAQQAQLGLGMPSANATSSPRPNTATNTPARPTMGSSRAQTPASQQSQPQPLPPPHPQPQPQVNGAMGPPTPAQNHAQVPAPAQGGAQPQRIAPAPGQTAPPAQSPQTVAFLKTLADFYQKKGVPFSGAPIIEGRQLDLARMFAVVAQLGGLAGVTSGRKWGLIASGLGFPAPSPDQHPEQRLQALMQAYQQVLFPFEQYWTQMQQARLAQAQQQQQQRSQTTASTPTPLGNGAASPPAPVGNPFAHSSTPAPAGPGTPQQTQPSRPSTGTRRPTSRAALTPGPAAVPAQSAPSPYSAHSMPAQAASPFAAAGTRPGTASGLSDESKGKAKAEVEGHMTGPAVPSSAPSGPSYPAATPTTAAAPPEPTGPPRRKRRRIEYTPLARPLDTHGGIDLALVEAITHRVDKMRPRRTAADLGMVDVHSLTMSLRSRIAREVSYALNVLATIAMTPPHEANFRLHHNAELVEELLDLLEDTAFGADGQGDEVAEVCPASPPRRSDAKSSSPSRMRPQTYRELFRLVEEEASDLAPLPVPQVGGESGSGDADGGDPEDDGLSLLRPAEVTVAIVNVVRTFAFDPEDARYLASDGRAAELLVRAASLPLAAARPTITKAAPRWPVYVTAAHSMHLKKAALETLAAFGTDVRLDRFTASTAQKAIDLLLFFVRHPHTHHEPWLFDLSRTPGMASKMPQVHALPPGPHQGTAIPPYLDLGLSAFAHVVLPDANRAVVGRLLGSEELHALFEALIQLLPVAEADFQIMTFEVGIVHVYNTIMTLYNLAFLAPAAVKARLGADPKVVKSLLRVVRRLAGTLSVSSDAEIWQGIVERCIAILRLLDEVGRPVSGAKAAQQGASADLPWWGLSMSGLDDDAGVADDAPGDGAEEEIKGEDWDTEGPRDGDRAQRDHPAMGPLPPILAGEVRALFEAVQVGSLQLAIPALAQMADATRGTGARRRGR